MIDEEQGNINVPYGFTQTTLPLQRSKRSLVPTEFANYPERFVRARQGSYEYNVPNLGNVPSLPFQRVKRGLSQTATSSSSPNFNGRLVRPRQGSYEYKTQQEIPNEQFINQEQEETVFEPFLTEPMRPLPYQFLEENLPSWANEYQPPPPPVPRWLTSPGHSLVATLPRGKRRLRNNSPEQILATRSRQNNERPDTLTNHRMATEEAENNLNLQQLSLQETPLNPPISPQVISNIVQNLNEQIYSILQNLHRLYQINAGQVQVQSPAQVEQLLRVISQQLIRLRRSDVLRGLGRIGLSRIPQIERQLEYIIRVLEQAYAEASVPEMWATNIQQLQSLQPLRLL